MESVPGLPQFLAQGEQSHAAQTGTAVLFPTCLVELARNILRPVQNTQNVCFVWFRAIEYQPLPKGSSDPPDSHSLSFLALEIGTPPNQRHRLNLCECFTKCFQKSICHRLRGLSLKIKCNPENVRSCLRRSSDRYHLTLFRSAACFRTAARMSSRS